jgi:hypothetical protein
LQLQAGRLLQDADLALRRKEKDAVTIVNQAFAQRSSTAKILSESVF